MVAPRRVSTAGISEPVTRLWGVGQERAAQLERLGIRTVEDLLLHQPRRYEDRRRFCLIRELKADAASLTRGTVVGAGVKDFQKGVKSIFELILDDGSGRLHCRWWNSTFMQRYYEVGDEVVVFGHVVGLKPRVMEHPETEVVEGREEAFIHFERITPIYPLTEGITQRWLRGLIWRALERYGGQIAEPWPSGLSVGCLAQCDGAAACRPLATREEAVRRLHFPADLGDVERARRRLALDEFVEVQVQLRQRRLRFETQAVGLACGGVGNRLIRPFLRQLGFRLTAAQARVLREMRSDMAGQHPMRRLLQGDVGSGKTVVAACAALMAIESGYGVALMAPTEILAEQHYANFQRWFEPLGIPVGLKTGTRRWVQQLQSERRHTQASGAKSGWLTVGTQALITEGFALPHLGLVIMDEQQKFGVSERDALVRKGEFPHVLVMTATPIPRTLALTLYGDLDVSVINELPSGRGRVKTFVRGAESLAKVWGFVRKMLSAGRQAFIVYPRVEETDAGMVKAAVKEYERVQEALAPFHVGLVHGRLAAAARAEVMVAFRENRIHALAATSLIEVGVDVPNATVMVIENAEKFGLSQLHQLRGRIGRGEADAYCILVAAAGSEEARARLRVLEKSCDGFEIAEADLRLRGPGEFLGRQQSGFPAFRFAKLADDVELMRVARDVAQRLVG
jgi:ATP-dependent DNA helicase RecG